MGMSYFTTKMLYFLIASIISISNGFQLHTHTRQATRLSSRKASSGVTPVELNAGLFIRGYQLNDKSICEELSTVFTKRRSSGAFLPGQVSMKGGTDAVVNKEVKDSEEISFHPNSDSPEFRKYLGGLQEAIASYLQEFHFADAYGKFGLTSRTNLQWYPPGGGYKVYHTERTGKGEPEGSRHLVFMTYLNDVLDGGGTEFYHQGVTVQPVKGLTLIWPSDWTFTHRGVPSPSQEKSIVTGWFNFS